MALCYTPPPPMIAKVATFSVNPAHELIFHRNCQVCFNLFYNYFINVMYEYAYGQVNSTESTHRRYC
jgi:hypothetical protein